MELNFKELDAYLESALDVRNRKSASNVHPPAVILIYGEEMIRKVACEKVVKALLPGKGQQFSFEPIDGAVTGVHEAVEKLNTFALLSGPKVVGWLEATLFDSGPDTDRLLSGARQAHEARNLRRAADYLLRFMAQAELVFEDLEAPNRIKNLPANTVASDDDRWIDDILDYCRQKGRTVPRASDNESVLCRAIENGFPHGNHLVITTDTIDKRRKVFNTIRDSGVIIDCSVPKGDRKADKKLQESVLLETMNRILNENGRTMARDAFLALEEMTGFDLRAFTNNLEKLVSYAGDRERITRKDVLAVLQRTKKDPVYAFTGAVAARNLDDALFYLGTLMNEGQNGLRPEQILVAMLNQIRKILRVKEFILSPRGRVWSTGCPFNFFKSKVAPALQAFDAELLDQLQGWQTVLDSTLVNGEGPSKKPRKAKKRPPVSDLQILRNLNNPYPVYQLFLSADRFSLKELQQAYDHLAQADLGIKSTGNNKKQILEEAVLSICRPAE